MARQESNPVTITTKRYDRPHIESVIHIVQRGQRLGSGYEGEIYRAGVVSERAPQRLVSFAHKVFNEDHERLAPYSRIFRNYTLMKEAGFPVPRTYRMTDDEKGIVMTDLSEGGKNIVLSRNNSVLDEIKRLYKQRSDTMQQFSQTKDLLCDTVAEQMEHFAQKAAGIDLTLPKDSLFVIVKPDGAYDFILGDFTLIRTSKELRDERPEIKKDLLAFNQDNLEEFRGFVSPIQRYGTDPEGVAKGKFYSE